jgi:type IV pilus assembly protein PilE
MNRQGLHLRVKPRGFSLLELLIVLGLMAILAAVSIPSYRDHVRRAHRAQARVALLQAAQFMQQFHATHDRFDRRSDAASGTAIEIPEALRTVPANGAPSYRVSLQSVDVANYVLAATPVGVMTDDPCGTLTLDSKGGQGAAGSTAHRCWH